MRSSCVNRLAHACSPFSFHLLIHEIMRVGFARQLRLMGDADHLVTAGQFFHDDTHLFGGFSWRYRCLSHRISGSVMPRNGPPMTLYRASSRLSFPTGGHLRIGPELVAFIGVRTGIQSYPDHSSCSASCSIDPVMRALGIPTWASNSIHFLLERRDLRFALRD